MTHYAGPTVVLGPAGGPVAQRYETASDLPDKAGAFSAAAICSRSAFRHTDSPRLRSRDGVDSQSPRPSSGPGVVSCLFHFLGRSQQLPRFGNGHTGPDRKPK